ncbi:hypothetical protein BGX29_007339 [Mortierella sp. GBA35]|nr:hypothetical protein BGX29_007339 [Mortierella sp. GBA35]KAG0212858.1 hypothetical protein BGX33_003336 [Mortierella sp. NVP41]
MPPKKRPAGEEAIGEEARKRSATTTTAGKSVSISTPGAAAGGAGAKPGAARPSPAGARPGTVRGTPKPGVRKVGAASALANRGRLPGAAGGAGGTNVVKKEAPPPIVSKNTLMWFRNDLRLQDNRALVEASKRAQIDPEKQKYVFGLYIVSEKEWASHDEAPVKIDFWMRNLEKLKDSLAKLNIPLIVKRAANKAEVVGVVESTVKENGISHVFWNAEYLVDEMARDAKVKEALVKLPGTYVEEHHDQFVVPPNEMKTKIGEHFSSFTTFSTTWHTLVETNPKFLKFSDSPSANPEAAQQLYAELFTATVPTLRRYTMDEEEIDRLYPAGEDIAHERLAIFVQEKVKRYGVTRDCLQEQDHQSLSPYLVSGVLSARQCIAAARAVNNNKIIVGNEGVKAWVKEIVWREFYRYIALAFPKVCKNKTFIEFTENLRYSNDDRKFQMWCQGKTGYPIVDAGMRQLNATGYMHSRVRNIAACFLVKDLLINWQKGERYFMNNLIDGDFPVNNGNWQWCASTGIEGQPYFRILNPLTQSQKFDPTGDYIRQWVPELRNLTDKQAHDPYHTMSAKDFGKLAYPKPIVDHAEAKKKYVDEFKRVLAQK